MTQSLIASLSLPSGEETTVVSFHLREGLSQRVEARVEIVTPGDIDLSSAIGGSVALQLSGTATRRWSLQLAQARHLDSKASLERHELLLFDAPWLLGLGEDTRKFRNLSAKDIVSQILGDGGVAHDWQLSGDLPVRKYCAQYRESDLTFVERLLEHEGVFYAFGDDGAMTLADDSTRAAPVSDTVFELIQAEMSHGEAGIFAFERGSRARPGRVTLGDYNWKTPHVTLRETLAADKDADLDVYQYPAGYRQPTQGKHLAQLRLEAHRVGADFVRGSSSVAGFGPGLKLSFGALAGDAFAGDYLLVEVAHRYHNGAFSGDDASSDGQYTNDFEAIPASQRFRPPLKTPRPTVQGSHSAIVRGPAGEEIHTDRHGRFRAQFHWDRQAQGSDEDSRWLRKLQESSTGMNLARTGWEMLVGYVDGDPERPLGIARCINGVAIPSYGLPLNKKSMTIKTPSSPATGGFSELKLDDTAGAQGIYLRAEKDFQRLVKNDKSETIGNDARHTVGSDLALSIGGSQSIDVGANAQATYGAEQGVTVGHNRSLTVGGNESVAVSGSAVRSIGGNDSEKVGGSRTTTTGAMADLDIGELAKSTAKFAGAAYLTNIVPLAGSFVDGGQNPLDMLTIGGIKRAANVAVVKKVGGAYIVTCLRPLNVSVGKHYVEVVGGVRLTATPKSISHTVTALYSQTVGAISLRMAKSYIRFKSKLVVTNVGGAAQLSSAAGIDLKAPAIALTAGALLTLTGGDTKLELAPSGMTFEGKLKLTAGEKISFSGGTLDVT
jgi:type VI secretion system secreted protein VgrG